MRIAFMAHFRGGQESGILRKVASQAAAWARSGADVGLFVATAPESAAAWQALPEAVVVRTPPSGPFSLLREREALVRDVESWSPDLVYLRHGLAHPSLLRLARRRPCVIEVNGDDLAEAGLKSTSRHAFLRLTRGSLLSRAAGLVFVTHELQSMESFARYSRPSVVIANGIDLSATRTAPVVSNKDPRLVFIGHPETPWHGLDHVEEVAAAFPTWRIDVIGPRDNELKKALPNLTAHGPMDEAAYRPLIDRADVAFGTLGLYRKHMTEACPLKVREYLASGIPAVIGYQDTDFPDGAAFLLEVPNQPSGVASSMSRIGAFVDLWRGRRVARSDIAHLDVATKEEARLQFLTAVSNA